MNLLLAARLAGWLLVFMAAFELPPLLAAFLFGEPLTPWLVNIGLTVAVGLPLVTGVRSDNVRIRPRDGFFIVTSAWVIASVAGAVPFMVMGVLGPVDALFESVAGFTTTGSTVLVDIEGTARSLLLWRSLTQWLGGMGIVVFTIALMPVLGIGGMQLFRAEVPGPVAEKIRPRVTSTARRLWLIYVGLTAAEWVALVIAGMSPFDALCHSLTTLATGGFSTRGASVGAFESPAIEWIVIVFMILAGMNFVLHYKVIAGRVREAGRDSELHYFVGTVAVASMAVAIAVWASGAEAGGAPFRASVFQVVSVVTTTGFATADFELWPSFTHMVLLIMMVLGAMAGSTSGGVKSLRAVLAFRAVRNSFSVTGHRNAVRPAVHYGGKPVPNDVLASIWVFLALYFLLAAATALLITAAGYDVDTAISGSLTSLGNVGPGLGQIGPYDHFAHFPAVVKLGLVFCMLAGRLELFTLMVLLLPSFWRR